MTKYNKDSEYLLIINDVIENEKFKQIGNIKHHNTTRLDHSLKVSYYSYRIAKRLKLDYKDVAIGGLLHDFYDKEISDYKKITDKVKLFTIGHPQEAIINAKEIYSLSPKEEDIIRTHMFPIDYKLPKYAESWVVSFVDKGLSLNEFFNKFKYKFIYISNMYLLFILNTLK